MRSACLSFVLIGSLSACGGGSTTEPLPAATLTITAPATTMASGTTLQASAMITIGAAAPVPATNVTWSSSNRDIVTVSPDGLITGAVAGSANITAQSGTTSGLFTIKVVPGEASTLFKYAGDGQVGAKGSTLFDPLCIVILDAKGNMLIGEMVTYAVATGGGTLNPPFTTPTDSRGIATSGSWKLGPNVGTQTVVATYKTLSATFSATAQ